MNQLRAEALDLEGIHLEADERSKIWMERSLAGMERSAARMERSTPLWKGQLLGWKDNLIILSNEFLSTNNGKL